MPRLVCARVVCKPQKTGFLATRPIYKPHMVYQFLNKFRFFCLVIKISKEDKNIPDSHHNHHNHFLLSGTVGRILVGTSGHIPRNCTINISSICHFKYVLCVLNHVKHVKQV